MNGDVTAIGRVPALANELAAYPETYQILLSLIGNKQQQYETAGSIHGEAEGSTVGYNDDNNDGNGIDQFLRYSFE